MDGRQTNEYEPVPQLGVQRAAEGSDVSRRSSLSESSRRSAEVRSLLPTSSANSEISPPSSLRRRSQDSSLGHDDYLPVSRASNDRDEPPDGFDSGRRSLDATEETRSAATLVGNEGSRPSEVTDELAAKPPDTAKPETDEGRQMRPWTPFYLQKMTLAGFVFTYVALLTTIVALGVFDQKNQGLATSKSSRHYLWQYGPTAVLTIVAAFWGQVEHRTKQMMPWAVLQKTPSPAADTLLMDYVEPARFFALPRSIKNAHWPVMFAIIGTLLLQLLTVTSTGLFQLQSETINHQNVALLYQQQFASEPSSDFSVGPAPVLSAIALNNGNLSYAAGTSERLAFSALSLKSGISGAENLTMSSSVEVFDSELSCETVQNPRWDDTCFAGSSVYGDCKSAAAVVSFNASSCRVEDLKMGMISGTSQAGLFSYIVAANCSNNPSDNRIVMVSTRYGLGRNYTGELPDKSIKKLLMEPAPILLCRPKYTIDTRRITMDGSGSLVFDGPSNESMARKADQLPIAQWDLVEKVNQSTEQAATAARGPAGDVQDINFDGPSNTRPYLNDFMYCIVAFLNPDNVTDILDLDYLQKGVSRFYRIVAAQMAKDYLMVPSDGQLPGDVTADQQRLRIRGLSFYMMEAILALLIVVGLVLFFLAPRNAVSRDPGSIGGLATIMAESPSFYESLTGCGILGLVSLRDRLSNYLAFTSNAEFRVFMVSQKAVTAVTAGVTKEEGRWWKPLAISRITKTGVTIYLLALVAALESTYQASRKHDGLANVETKSYVRYAWSYIPALSMFIAQLLVGMIGDIAKIFAPYYELRRKSPVPTKALFNDPLSQLTLQTFVKAIPTRQFALLATSFAMLLTPLLTIVASGLFSPETSPYSQDVTAHFDDMFNLTWSPLTDTLTSTFVVGLLLQGNLSYPAWTYGELALPRLSLDTMQHTGERINISHPSFNGSILHVTVPTPRASLNCTYLPHDQISYSWDNITDRPRVSLPRLSANNSSDNSGCENFYPDIDGSISRPFGFTAFTTDACSYIRGVYGPSTTDNSTAQAFYCSPSIEQVRVNVTLQLPAYTVLDAAPLEDSATPYSPISANWDWSDFDLGTILPGAGYNTSNSTTGSYDPVFQAVLDQTSTNRIAADALFGEENFPRLAQAVQHFFRLAFAQVLNLEFRTPPTSSSEALNATVTIPTRLRLKQSPISTRILEGLLLVITACLVVSFVLSSRTRHILPKNPCSIGAAASLLADAQMLRGAPRGVAWWGEGEVVEGNAFGEEGFSMGFWDGGFGIDGGKAAEKESREEDR